MINRLLMLSLFVLCACKPYKDKGAKTQLSEAQMMNIDKAAGIKSFEAFPRRIRKSRFFKRYRFINDLVLFTDTALHASLFLSGAYNHRSRDGYVLLRDHEYNDTAYHNACILFHTHGRSIDISIYQDLPDVCTWTDTQAVLDSSTEGLFWGYTATKREAKKMQRKSRRAMHQ